MPVETLLISHPAIDFNTLLGLAHQALGYSIARNADASHRKMVDAEKFLSCLAAFSDRSAEITTNLLSHVSYSVLVIADERDLPSILDVTSGMPFVRSPAAPRTEMAIISGTLLEWRNAVISGTSETIPPAVRTCYSQILLSFDRAGLTTVWDDYERTAAPDRNGFILERRRR